MIWFFERQQSRLHYEIRHQTDGHAYELVITHPDGRQEIELFSDPLALIERSEDLQALAAGRRLAPAAAAAQISRPESGQLRVVRPESRSPWSQSSVSPERRDK